MADSQKNRVSLRRKSLTPPFHALLAFQFNRFGVIRLAVPSVPHQCRRELSLFIAWKLYKSLGPFFGPTESLFFALDDDELADTNI